MKVRLRRESDIDRRLRKLPYAALRGPSYADLKRDLSIVAVITQALGEPDAIRGEPRWCCFLHPDRHPSLWARDEKARWGCNPCGVSGDVFDFVSQYYHLPLKGAEIFLRGRYEEFRL
jgi:DNA primase